MTSRIVRRVGTGYRVDRQRNAQRTLGTAEGILVALGWCSLDNAFAEIVETARRHNVSVIQLATALAAIADDKIAHDPHDEVLAAAKRAWGSLADRLHTRTEPTRAHAARDSAPDPTGPAVPSYTTVIDPIPLGDDT